MTARSAQAAGIAGLALLGCGLMLLFVGMSQALTEYGPPVRNWLLSCDPLMIFVATWLACIGLAGLGLWKWPK